MDFVNYMVSYDAIKEFNQGASPAANLSVEDIGALSKVQEDGIAMLKSCTFFAPVKDRIKPAAWENFWKEVINVLNGAKDAKDILVAFDLNGN